MNRREKGQKLLDLILGSIVTHDDGIVTYDGDVVTSADDQTLEAIADVMDGKARRKRGRRAAGKPRPLTARQLEALGRVAECKGNIAEAARQLGVDRKTVRQHVDAGLTKLSLSLPQYLRDHKPGKTLKQPTDLRGQETLASDDHGPAAPDSPNGLPITHEARMKIRRTRPS